jgi:signal transduction histidine kinase
MIVLSPLMLGLVAVIAALWLAAAVAATIRANRIATAAEGLLERSAWLEGLIGAAPAVPLAVTPDGTIELPPRLADWLSLTRSVDRLAELTGEGSGLVAEDLARLVEEVTATARSGATISRVVRVAGSSRALKVEGRRAAEGAAASGTVILWFIDATASEEALAGLRGQVERLDNALDAMSAIIEAAPIPMWHRSPDLRLTLVNSAYVVAVEARDAADAVARGLELVEPVGGVSAIAAAAAARKQGEPSTRVVPAIIGGERRRLRVVDVPLGEAGVAGFAVDVEEIEQARGALDRFAQAQRDLLDRLSAGVAQFAADQGLIFSNQAFARMFALKPEWLADRPEFDRVLERMRESDRLPESRDFPGWKADRRAWFIEASREIEENWLLPGGTHLRVVAQPLPDGGLLLIFEDRTEQVALASARDTLLRVRTATFDNLFEAIAVFAADGRLQLWNSRFREVWGLEDALLDQHPRVDALVAAVSSRLASPTRADRIRDLVRSATIERRNHSGRIAFADGRHLEFAAVPLPDGNALFTLLDITDSRRIEAALRERAEALEAADRVKTAFVANMSYELRTPLTSIGGFAEMLAAGYAGKLSRQAKDYVASILEAVARLANLVDDVLALTSGEAPPGEDELEEIVIADLARDAAAGFAAAAETRGLDLETRLDESAGQLRGDPRRLRQAVDHLLRNAIAHTPAGGRVLLHVAGDDAAVTITVSDNGAGIPPEEKARVFDRFHRATLAPRDGDAALGLGLPLTRQFVEQHGGSVTLESEPGEGTTVTIWLPRRR